MSTNYITRYHVLVEEAFQAIVTLLQEKGEIILLTQDDIDDNENSTVSLYDDVPDFAITDRYNYIQNAAIQKVVLDDTHIMVTGVFKGDNFPGTITVSLDEVDSYYAIVLADYLYDESEG